MLQGADCGPEHKLYLHTPLTSDSIVQAFTMEQNSGPKFGNTQQLSVSLRTRKTSPIFGTDFNAMNDDVTAQRKISRPFSLFYLFNLQYQKVQKK